MLTITIYKMPNAIGAGPTCEISQSEQLRALLTFQGVACVFSSVEYESVSRSRFNRILQFRA